MLRQNLHRQAVTASGFCEAVSTTQGGDCFAAAAQNIPVLSSRALFSEAIPNSAGGDCFAKGARSDSLPMKILLQHKVRRTLGYCSEHSRAVIASALQRSDPQAARERLLRKRRSQ